MSEDSKPSVPPVVKRIAEQTPDSPVPICVLVVGMAGSGKTTLMSQLQNSTMKYDDDEGTGEEVGSEEKEDVNDNDKKP